MVVIDENDNKVVDKLSTTIYTPPFNWYWLVDGLMDHSSQVDLVNTAAVKGYDGLKYSDHHQDAFHLAHLMRLGILPTGHIYPPEYRQVRDLLRRRRQLVKHASSHVISIQNQIWRSLGYRVGCIDIHRKRFRLPFEPGSFLYHSANSNVIILKALDKQIDLIAQQTLEAVKPKDEFK
ncbi:MAG: transposase [Paraglaciecola sp.]